MANTSKIAAILLAIFASAPAFAAQQTISTIGVPPTAGSFRGVLNAQLTKTQMNFVELNRFDTNLLESINGGSPNGAGSKVHWSQLAGVPAGIADGTDDGGSGSSSGTDDQTAAEVPFTPYGDITASNVQAAISQVRSLAIAGGIPDAPSDSNVYARSNANWITLSGLYQPLNANLTTMAGVTSSANGRSLISAADYVSMRTLLSLVPGTNVQAYHANLTSWSAVAPGSNVPAFLSAPSGANLAAALTSALPASKGGTGITSLGTGVPAALGNAVGAAGGLQPYDADLVTAAGADSASASTYFGKNSGGTVGFHALPSGGTGTPGGSDTQVQFNDSASFGGDSGLTYNKTTDALTVAGAVTGGSFASSAANGNRYAQIPNTVTLTSTPTLGRIAWLTDRFWLANGTNWTTRYLLDSSHVGSVVQAYDADLADLADGSLTASKVGNGFYVADSCSSVSSPATGAICFEY